MASTKCPHLTRNLIIILRRRVAPPRKEGKKAGVAVRVKLARLRSLIIILRRMVAPPRRKARRLQSEHTTLQEEGKKGALTKQEGKKVTAAAGNTVDDEHMFDGSPLGRAGRQEGCPCQARRQEGYTVATIATSNTVDDEHPT